MTSLQQQLGQLRTAQTDIFDTNRKTPSILHSDPSSIPRDVHHEIGFQGYEELVKIDKQFVDYSKLFDKNSIIISRAVMKRAENEELSNLIDRFLINVGPHLEKQCAKKALEWLIQRFMIHDLELDSFLSAILPYHETYTFTRILMVLNLSKNLKAWDWLIPVQKNGVKLSKKTLFAHWSSSQFFRNYIANNYIQQMKYCNPKTIKIYSSFFTLVATGGLTAAGKICEEHLTSIVRIMDKALEFPCLFVQSSMSFLLMSMSALTSLSESFVHQFIIKLCESDLITVPQNLVPILASVLQCQYITELPMKAALNLTKSKKFLDEMVAFSSKKNIIKFLYAFIPSSIKSLIAETQETAFLYERLVDCLEHVRLNNKDATLILELFVNVTKENLELLRESGIHFSSVLTRLEMQYPESFPESAPMQLLDQDTLKSYKENQINASEDMDVDSTLKKDGFKAKAMVKKLTSMTFFHKEFHHLKEEIYAEEMAEIIEIMKPFFDENEQSDIDKLEKILFKKILKTNKEKLYFLSMLWSTNKDFMCQISSKMKKWALEKAKFLICENCDFIIDPKETFIPSLLLPLCENDLVRDVFKLLKAVKKIFNGHCIYNDIITAFISFQEEIKDDISYFPYAIQKICEDKDILKLLTNILSSENTPFRIKSPLLYALSSLESKSLFSCAISLVEEILCGAKLNKLNSYESSCLYYSLLRLQNFSKKDLLNPAFKSLMLKCIRHPLGIINFRRKTYSPQMFFLESFVIEKLNEADDLKLDILRTLISLKTSLNELVLCEKSKKSLDKLTIPASMLLTLLGEINIQTDVKSVSEARKKRTKIAGIGKQEDISPWYQLDFIVEISMLIEISEPWLLINMLFRYLYLSMRLKSVFTEKFHPMILRLLYVMLDASKGQLNVNEFQQKMSPDVGLLVGFLRDYDKSDTVQRQALSIISMLTPYFPEKVLSNVISLFTFMGSSKVMKDNLYSIKVIDEALNTILPPLVKMAKKNPQDVLYKLSAIVKVFVTALPNIPHHRRVKLFTQIAKNIGVKYNWVIVVLIADGLLFNAKGELKMIISDRCHFLSTFLTQFDFLEQVDTTNSVIKFLVKIPKRIEKRSKSNKMAKSYGTVLNFDPDLVVNFDPDVYDDQKLHEFVYYCVNILISLLRSSKISEQIQSQSKEKTGIELTQLYNSILLELLPYMDAITKEISTETKAGEFWITLKEKLDELLELIIEMLTPHLLISVIVKLVGSQDVQVQCRCKAMEILGARLQPGSCYFSDKDISSATELIEVLLNCATDNSVPEDVRQTSLITLNCLVNSFGDTIYKKNKNSIAVIIESASSLLTNTSTPNIVKLQSLMVCAKIICIMGFNAVQFLEPVMGYNTEAMSSILSASQNKNESTSFILLSSVEKITGKIAKSLANWLVKIVMILCNYAVYSQNLQNDQLIALISSVEKNIFKLPPKIIIPHLKQAYNLLLESSIYMPSFFKQISVFYGFHKVSSIYKCIESTSLYKDFVRIRENINSTEHIDIIEQELFISWYTLMESSNADVTKKIFVDLKSISVTSKINLSVYITFYKFCCFLVHKFKLLFITLGFANSMFEDLCSYLDRYNAETSRKKIKKEDDACTFLNIVLDTLTAIFIHDSEELEFITSARINLCMKPIIDQIDNTLGDEGVYNTRIKDHLRPCISHLVASTSDDNLWVDITKEILSRIKTKPDDSLVIVGTLEVLEGVIEKAGENFVRSQLVEIMVHIAEALEISDLEVETKAKSVFAKMEEILGENLQGYLES